MKRKIAVIILSLVCVLCLSFGLVACGGAEKNGGHTHKYAWTDNGDGTHSGHCSVAGCDKPDVENEAHDWGKNGKCKKCPAVKSEHSHKWSTEWNNDGTHHWHECEVDGCDVTDNSKKDGYAAHDFTNGDCICGKTHPHAWAETWSNNDTHHWHKCTVEGCSEKTDYAEHDFVGNTCETCKLVVTETAGITYKAATGGYAVSGYKGTSKNVIIPAEHDGQPVLTIDENAFRGSDVNYVQIPDSVTEIEQYAFWACGATNIVISDGVEKIGYCAFGGCENLTEITVPQSVTEMAYYVFYYSGCTKVALNAAITSIPYGTFQGCENLQSVTLSDSITSIGRQAFYECVALTSIGDVKNITRVDAYAFMNDANFDMPTDGLTSIDEGAFAGAGIKEAVIKVKTVNSKMFADCKKLGRVELTDAVTSVGEQAFVGCTALTELRIGAGLSTIGDTSSRGMAFSGCTALRTLTVDANNEKYKSENNALMNKAGTLLYLANAAGDIPDGVSTIGNGAFMNSSVKNLVIPDSVFNLGRYMLKDTKVESVTFGKNASGSLVYGMFEGCNELSSISVSPENTKLQVKGNCLIAYINSKYNLIGGCKTSVIPTDIAIEQISQYAFSGLDGLNAITIPGNVNKIYDYAFGYCSNLATVNIEEGVQEIGSYSFNMCGIKTLNIPSSITSVKPNSFYGCGGTLETINVADGNTKYAAVGNCLIDKSAKTLMLGCKNGAIPDDGTVTSIGYNAFAYATASNITIPDGITSINDGAFYGCAELTNITIADSVTSIGRNAFYNCAALTDITFNGTKAQWTDVTKGSGWNTGAGNFTVACSDGKLDKNGIEIAE